MHFRKQFFFATLTLALLATPATLAANDDSKQAPLSDSEFKELHSSLVQPTAPWNSIPWQTSLIKAQNLAVQQGKLILIWSMDGHPLGCT